MVSRTPRATRKQRSSSAKRTKPKPKPSTQTAGFSSQPTNMRFVWENRFNNSLHRDECVSAAVLSPRRSRSGA
ncbi:hypothetical protein AOLI_G00259320 [Acnodon oligacanthus]